MTEFRPGQPAPVVDSALKSAAQTMDAAKQNAVLWFGEILERGLFRQLGYSSINQYARCELGFSDSRIGDFLSICRRLKRLPRVQEELAAGRLGYTHAREVVKVADERNEREWVDLARRSSRRELEEEVRRAKRIASEEAVAQPTLLPAEDTAPIAAPPVRVGMEMTALQFAKYEALWERLRKLGGLPADAAEAMLEVLQMAACHAAEESPRGDLVAGAPPVQVHVHRCPDCEQAAVTTGRGERKLGVAEIERAWCDCRIDRPGERNRSLIPPAVRREVLARARHRCRRPGCGHVRFLEIHHIVPRSRGGTNDPRNLIVLCSACHGLAHRPGATPPDSRFINLGGSDFIVGTGVAPGPRSESR